MGKQTREISSITEAPSQTEIQDSDVTSNTDFVPVAIVVVAAIAVVVISVFINKALKNKRKL